MKLPDKKYNTIVIDPPWDISMGAKVRRRPNRAMSLPYETMSLKEIEQIQIGNMANKGCHIYLWTTNKMLHSAFHIFEEWGVYFHLCLVLVKPSMIVPSFDYKFATEFCLLGFYEKPKQKFIGMGELNWFKGFNKAGQHSSKPNEFYNIVRDMSPPPRLDMFSRRCIAGFDSWGDQAPKEKQLMLGSDGK